MVGLSESVRLELRGTGVNISCVQPAIVATELSAGVKQVRVVRSVTPEAVARAVVRAIERPRFDVFVPRELGVVIGLSNALPRRAKRPLLVCWELTTFCWPPWTAKAGRRTSNGRPL